MKRWHWHGLTVYIGIFLQAQLIDTILLLMAKSPFTSKPNYNGKQDIRLEMFSHICIFQTFRNPLSTSETISYAPLHNIFLDRTFPLLCSPQNNKQTVCKLSNTSSCVQRRKENYKEFRPTFWTRWNWSVLLMDDTDLPRFKEAERREGMLDMLCAYGSAEAMRQWHFHL